MLRDLFASGGDFGIYGILSTIVFLVFFVLLTIYAIVMRNQDAEGYSRMPLDESPEKSDEIQEI